MTETGADAYTGPVGTAKGTVFAMEPPSFAPVVNDPVPLEKPAKVSIYAYGIQWSTDYDPVTGFALVDVPAGSFYALVEDVDDGNGIMPSLIGAGLAADTETTWEIPVTRRSTLEEIYSANSLEIDPDKAQLIFSVVDCSFNGGDPIAGFELVAPAESEGILYHDGVSWVMNAPGGTGVLGMAIVVNAAAQDYPGVLSTLTYKTGSGTAETAEFRSFAGSVVRVYFSLPC